MVANAGDLLKIENQCVDGVGVGVMQMKFVTALFLTLQEGIVFADKLPHVAALILAPGRIEWAKHSSAGQANGDFMVGKGMLGVAHDGLLNQGLVQE
jgi:hypothetical protein